jgi:triosephosphate isomerase (TIM)
MRGKLMAGNWKMYKTRAQAEAFIQALDDQLPEIVFQGGDALQVMLCVAFPLLAPVLEQVQTSNVPVLVAAQTMDSHTEGAYTGEVSAPMLNDVGVQAVVLGHSERRQYFNETDNGVKDKTLAALAHNLLPIVCVGETLQEREAGDTDTVVLRQTNAVLGSLTAEQARNIVVAYEPVWAIGTGKVCEADEANRVCGVIRAALETAFGADVAQAVRILYGGSMKPDNGEVLLSQPHIDGGLIGGASLAPDSFVQLIQQAAQSLTAVASV